MKVYSVYIYIILTLAIVLNWVVVGGNDLGKIDLNLGLLPKFSIIIIEILQVFIFFYILLKKQFNIGKQLLFLGLFLLMNLLIILTLKGSIFTWVSGVRYYFSFYPVFLVGIIFGSKGYSIYKEFRYILFLILFQIPIVIFQFLEMSSISLSYKGPALFDMISGTMGGFASNVLSLFIAIGFIYFLIKYFETKRVLYLVICIVLLALPIMAEAKGMLVVVLIALVSLMSDNKKNFLNLFIVLIGSILFYFIFNFLYSQFGYDKVLDYDYLVDYASSSSGQDRLSRIDSIINAFSTIFSNNSPIFGLGIGNANKSPFGDGQFYDFFTIRHSLDIWITETGIFGLIFLLFLFFRVRKTCSFIIVNSHFFSVFDFRLAKLIKAMSLVLLFGIVWVDILFRVQFMYPFGFIYGYAFGLEYSAKKSNVIVN